MCPGAWQPQRLAASRPTLLCVHKIETQPSPLLLHSFMPRRPRPHLHLVRRPVALCCNAYKSSMHCRATKAPQQNVNGGHGNIKHKRAGQHVSTHLENNRALRSEQERSKQCKPEANACSSGSRAIGAAHGMCCRCRCWLAGSFSRCCRWPPLHLAGAPATALAAGRHQLQRLRPCRQAGHQQQRSRRCSLPAAGRGPSGRRQHRGSLEQSGSAGCPAGERER